MTTEEEMDFLSRPHVARCWFGEFDMPTGPVLLHNGVGRVTVGGQEYRGVSDPIGGQMVSISAVENARFGTAAKVDIVIAGVTVDAWRQWKADARDIEGRNATLRFGVFDPETGEVLLFKRMLPGSMSAPRRKRQGIGTRYIGLTIEGFWEAQNYSFGGRWTDADQRRRFPGDKGLMFLGTKVHEAWR